MSADELALIERWIIANVTERVVPNDEGNGLALVYNLVHLARGDGQKYEYLQEQDDEIASLGLKFVKSPPPVEALRLK